VSEQGVLVETGPDEGLVWHYGNPFAETRALEEGKGVVALGNRDVVEISGDDRLELLHLISTQHMHNVGAGDSGALLILDSAGHIEHVLHFADDGDSLLGWTEPGRGAALVEHVLRMRFAMRVEACVRDDLTLYWLGHTVPVPDGARVRHSDLGGTEVFAAEPMQGTAGTWAFEALRIAAGVPRIFVDTDERTIPNEIGLYGTHLDKGCYPGQETVAKVHTLGRPPRRLVQLHLDGSRSTLPGLGSELKLGEKVVGRVGSSVLHREIGPLALALVKRNVSLDVQLDADGIEAAQEMLVDPDVGLHVRPRLR